MSVLIKRLFFSWGNVSWSANMLISFIHRFTGVAAIVLLTVGFLVEQKIVLYYGLELLFHPLFMVSLFLLFTIIHYLVGLNKA